MEYLMTNIPIENLDDGLKHNLRARTRRFRTHPTNGMPVIPAAAKIPK